METKSRKLHLISNAHLDPVWQWEWEEGAAAAVSTFRCAARFCREFDGYIFCHNESLLYRWVEEYEPSLFEEIRELVKLGKWHIMGGWHLQPDCNMPSGEAFVRQIAEGNRYFKEKFGTVPKTAINFDPFGHTRGLVQIIARAGYKNYLFCRPDPGSCPLPAETFRWIGYDGSEVIGQRCPSYNSGFGHAVDKVRGDAAALSEENPIGVCLWGVGDHGGGPSRIDIRAINEFIEEQRKNGVTVLHSTPDDYFNDIRESEKELPTHAADLNLWAPGCYTSQVRIKQKYRQLENEIYSTEKMFSHLTAINDAVSYPEREIGEALYDLLTVQFHDAIPGSSIQPVEEMCIRMLDHGLEIISRLRARAFFALSAGQPEARDGEIPILAYNPHPYAVEGDFECEFMLADQNGSGTFTVPTVYCGDTALPTQCEKEMSNIPLDWRKRAVFHARLEPMSMNRFDCRLEQIPQKPALDISKYDSGDGYYTVKTPTTCVKINRSTGLINEWSKNGVTYMTKDSLGIDVMQDRNDSWGMTVHAFSDKIGRFELLSDEEGTRFSNQASTVPSIRLVEDGDVRAVIEAVFGYNTSRAVVRYKISMGSPRIDVEMRIINDEKCKMYKVAIPSVSKEVTPALEVAFGEEPMRMDLTECVGQKYLTVKQDAGRLNIYNNGIYGSSANAEGVYITLLRSPAYTAHPIGDRPVMPTDRHSAYMEQGERLFCLSLEIEDSESQSQVSRKALAYNEAPTVLSFFPDGEPLKDGYTSACEPLITADEGSPVIMSALKKTDSGDGYILRMFNPTKDSTTCRIVSKLFSLDEVLEFTPYEIKTKRMSRGSIADTNILD